jgi:hypothetical protein
MQTFKRNQVEEAIVRTLGVEHTRIADLAIKMKRLLVTDRRLGRGKQGGGHRGYAFYSDKPPGSGAEVMFIGYEAFALLAALVVLNHGIPQAKVVSILREVRPDLEAAHREILQKDPKALFDPQEVRTIARTGTIAVDNTSPTFLTFVKVQARKGMIDATIAVCRGHRELGKFLKEHSVPGSGTTLFELTRLMHRLADNLSKTRPTKRGRSAL